MAHGWLCTLASSQRVWLSWLHKHTGRAWRPVFVDTGLRGCEHLTWNISLAKRVRSRFFYLSLQTCLPDSVAALGSPPVTMNTLWILQHEYRIHNLTHKVLGGNMWASCLCCQCWWLPYVGSVGPVPSVSRKDSRAAAISCKGGLPEIPLTVTHKLVFFQGNGFYLLWILHTEKLLTKTK